MGKKTGSQEPQNQPDWSTPGARTRWLLHTLWGDNCLRMATEIGVSHTAINKIARAGREPGRRLLQAIADHPKVNPGWLLANEGEPLLEPAGVLATIPVAEAALPGSPRQHRTLLTDRTLHLPTLSPTLYWLQLGPQEPLVTQGQCGFRAADLLLMETDRRRFPPAENLDTDLGVVRDHRHGRLRLAALIYNPPTHEEGSYLQADTFDLAVPRERRVEEFRILRYPDGKVDVSHQILKLANQSRGDDVPVEMSLEDLCPSRRTIQYADIVAVWTGLLHRADRLPWAW